MAQALSFTSDFKLGHYMKSTFPTKAVHACFKILLIDAPPSSSTSDVLVPGPFSFSLGAFSCFLMGLDLGRSYRHCGHRPVGSASVDVHQYSVSFFLRSPFEGCLCAKFSF